MTLQTDHPMKILKKTIKISRDIFFESLNFFKIDLLFLSLFFGVFLAIILVTIFFLGVLCVLLSADTNFFDDFQNQIEYIRQ